MAKHIKMLELAEHGDISVEPDVLAVVCVLRKTVGTKKCHFYSLDGLGV
jgi:hypothetical protein